MRGAANGTWSADYEPAQWKWSCASEQRCEHGHVCTGVLGSLLDKGGVGDQYAFAWILLGSDF